MVQLPSLPGPVRLPERLRAAGSRTGGGALATLSAVARHEIGGRRRRARTGSPEMPSPESIPAARESVVVDAGKNDAFARCVGARPGADAHGGYLHALTFPVSMKVLTSSAFPLPVLGLIHLSNTVTQHRAVATGTTVTVRSRIREFGTHRRGTTVTVVAEIWDAAGELAFTDESLYLSKGQGTQQGTSPEAAKPAPDSRPDPREGARLVAQWRLGADTGRRYAAVSGDANPIHLSALSAKAFGMKSSLAHGMYCASRALGTLESDPGAPGRWRVEFGAPVFLPATVALWQAKEGLAEGERVLRGIGRKNRLHFTVSWRPLEAPAS